jgi:sugar-specific transcriptional regulator TrmB
MDTSFLLQAGLTEGELKVYLALLKIGSATSGQIVKESGISRSIIYVILDKLIEKGLVSVVIQEKTKYFQAAIPNRILEYLDQKEEGIKDCKNKVKSILPDLIELQKHIPLNAVNMYLGINGVRTAYENLYSKLKKGDEYLSFGIPAYQPAMQHAYWQKDHLRRVKEGIHFKGLFNRDTDRKILKNRNNYKYADVRYMPVGTKSPACFFIYKDTVVIILQSPSAIAVEIVNKEITDSFREYFEDFWKKSKPLQLDH